jgi:hypothetical protein
MGTGHKERLPVREISAAGRRGAVSSSATATMRSAAILALEPGRALLVGLGDAGELGLTPRLGGQRVLDLRRARRR